MGGMIIRLTDIVVAAAGDDLTHNVSRLFKPNAAAAINALSVAPAGAPANENEENIIAARANLPNCDNWFADLLNAAHKSPVTAGNVEGYFASFGHTGTSTGAIVWLINSMKPFFPDSVGDQAFRDLLTPGCWTTYRITRVSAGKVLLSLRDDFRALNITAQGDQVEGLIDTSAAEPWNIDAANAIPDKYKAYASIFLQAAGTPIDNWHQGNKAAGNLPASRVRGAKATFARYLEVKNDIAGLNALNDVAAISGNASIQNFW
jgi:hypothetical protein